MRGLIQIIVGLVLTMAGWAAPQIDIEWSRQDCMPGDLVELRVRVSSDNVTGFDLNLPANDSLEWVVHDRGPLLYQAGRYTQEDVVIAQPTRAGTIQLKGLHAVVRDGKTKTDCDLAANPLAVGTYEAAEDSFTPEPLPERNAGGQTKGLSGLWIGLCILVLTVLAYVCRKKPQETVMPTEPMPVLEELGRLLANDDVTIEAIERLLVKRSRELSGELRDAVERFVYGSSGDLNGLRELLGMEVVR